jgi:hypothetical protein
VIVNITVTKIAAPFVTVVGSRYSFGRTCVRVYHATNSSKALIAGAKKIIIDRPPILKYLLGFVEMPN